MHDAIAIQLATSRVNDLTREASRDRARADARAARSRRSLRAERTSTARRLAFAPVARLLGS